jgi:hypothetical protein
MGFSAILADENNLIVPFAYHLQFGLTNHGISAQKALAVSGNKFKNHVINKDLLISDVQCL